jgi:hypothetical protein
VAWIVERSDPSEMMHGALAAEAYNSNCICKGRAGSEINEAYELTRMLGSSWGPVEDQY